MIFCICIIARWLVDWLDVMVERDIFLDLYLSEIKVLFIIQIIHKISFGPLQFSLRT